MVALGVTELPPSSAVTRQLNLGLGSRGLHVAVDVVTAATRPLVSWTGAQVRTQLQPRP